MKIKYCRICKSKKLLKVFNLGQLAFTGIFPESRNKKIPSGKLSLLHCSNCSLLQLSNNFDSNLMYGDNYGYMSSLNKAMEFHLKLKSKYLINTYKINSKKNVLDIGSNDGTFLKFFNKKNNLFACDPTIKKFKNFYRKDINLFPNFFSADIFSGKKFDLITSIAMFYDLPDPLMFARDIESILKNDGVWHIEMSYMPSMIKKNSYDTICHEHLEYYSIKSLSYLMKKANLKIINVSFNEVNGGSISLDVAKNKSNLYKKSPMVDWLLKRETMHGYNSHLVQKAFYQKCKNHKTLLKDLLVMLNKNGNKIYGYGASTKGNVILQYCKINNSLIRNVVEVNKFKYGRYTPGSKIKIISEKDAKKNPPDYFLVLPWHFKDHIINKEKKFLNNGGKFIFPLPEIEIV